MIYLAVMAASLLMIIQLFVLVYILYGKAKDKRFEAEVEKVFTNILPAYLSYITGESNYEPRLPKTEYLKKEVLERILNQVSGNSSNEEELNKIRLVAQRHLGDIYQKTLKKGKWADRVNALYFIEDFSMTDLKEHVRNHLSTVKEKDEEYRQTLRVLASFQDERMIAYLTEQQDISMGLIKELFNRLRSKSLHQLVSIIEEGEKEVPQIIEESLLTYFGESGEYEFLNFVEKKLYDSRLEIRIKAFKGLCHYQYTSDTDLIKRFFFSEHWEERMYAARLSGIMQLEEYIENLIALAGDSNWWVRYAASVAISLIPNGEQVLESIAKGHEDSYARDMAKQTLTMRGGM